MQIPLTDQCAPDNLGKIPEHLVELRNRYQQLKETRDETSKKIDEKLATLEQNVAAFNY